MKRLRPDMEAANNDGRDESECPRAGGTGYYDGQRKNKQAHTKPVIFGAVLGT